MWVLRFFHKLAYSLSTCSQPPSSLVEFVEEKTLVQLEEEGIFFMHFVSPSPLVPNVFP
jgi:hypothetical protein